MAWLDLEHGAIELRRLVQPPGAVTRHAQLVCLSRAERSPLPDRVVWFVHVLPPNSRSSHYSKRSSDFDAEPTELKCFTAPPTGSVMLLSRNN
jgi:hypothetical protein